MTTSRDIHAQRMADQEERAKLPANDRAGTPQELFNRAVDALEALIGDDVADHLAAWLEAYYGYHFHSTDNVLAILGGPGDDPETIIAAGFEAVLRDDALDAEVTHFTPAEAQELADMLKAEGLDGDDEVAA